MSAKSRNRQLRHIEVQAKSQSEFVIQEGSSSADESKQKAWGRHYRCQQVFDRLTTWLRDYGVEGNKPLHTLRKEAGAIVATEAGIYAASRFLRHADMQVTSQFYADHKQRIAIDMAALLPPANVIAIENDVDRTLSHSKKTRIKKV